MRKFFVSIFLLNIILSSNVIYAIPFGGGYFIAGPNPFFPDNTFANTSTPTWSINWTYTPIYNPDVYCGLQGSNWRVPARGEFDTRHRQFKIAGTLPFHPSSYLNEDIEGGVLLPTLSQRGVGGVINEWGDVSKYPSTGWSLKTYYAAEPDNATARNGVYVGHSGIAGATDVACIRNL